MKTKVVVFGTEQISSLAWFFLTHDSPYQVVAFTVDRAYLQRDTHEGLPVIPFEDLTVHYPPGEVHLLIALGYRRINGLRRERYLAAKAQGYKFVRYLSSHASTWSDLQWGEHCLIYDQAIIQPFVRIGDNASVRSGAHLAHHCNILDHSFVGARATLGGDVTVGEQAFIGIGAVIRSGLTIAARCFIGAGAVVVADTEADCVYVGNPARKIAKTALEVTGG